MNGMAGTAIVRTVRTATAPALCGLLAGAAGLSVAHLLAQLTNANSSPVVAVGGAVIDATPTPLKEFAIRTFGTHDKLVLMSGIVSVLAILTMAIGILAKRQFRYGVLAVALLGVVAVAAALSRPTARGSYAIPTIVGLLVAVGLLWLLQRPLRHASSDQVQAPPETRTIFVEGSRRQFLITGLGVTAATAASLATGTAVAKSKSVESARRLVRLPKPSQPAPALPAGVNLDIAGISPFVTPNGDFYRVDTALVVPRVTPNSWRLKIEGMVDKPFTLSYNDILNMPLIERDITLTCVSNEVGGPYAGNARWLGVPLRALMDRAGVDPAADQLFCTSSDGFTTSTPIKLALDGRDAMVAIGMNGEPLPTQHGFPARLVVPGLYGFVSACKWLTSIKVTQYGQKRAYWTQRGWDIDAPILTQTRIDVPAGFATVKAGTVAIAGVCWAQHRGIRKVEVSIDGGEWQPATLASTPSIDTWRQWWFKWDATTGRHQIRARSTDATGQVQIDRRQSVFPRGATGIQEAIVNVS
jgi:DMSO/TMAO reductase YedYZ molybdopterin-dependent catalytic subunit